MISLLRKTLVAAVAILPENGVGSHFGEMGKMRFGRGPDWRVGRLQGARCSATPRHAEALGCRKITQLAITSPDPSEANRPHSLARLLESLYRYFPQLPVVVVDDSRRPYARSLCQTRFAADPITPFEVEADLGPSACRTYGLDRITTRYFVLLEDNFVFRPETKLDHMREELVEAHWDIVAGTPVNHDADGQPYVESYEGHFVVVESVLVCCPLGQHQGSAPCNSVQDFFMANAERVRSMGGWDSSLGPDPSIDFFFRAMKHGMRVAHMADIFIDRNGGPGVPSAAFINQTAGSKGLCLRKHGLTHAVLFSGECLQSAKGWPTVKRSVTEYLS